MGKKARFSDYWQSIGAGTNDKLPKDSVIDAPSTVANFEYLLAALRSKAPGQWSQNLLELSRHFTSAAYLAINTLANQASSAEIHVFERTPDPHEADIELPWTEPCVRLLENPNNDDSAGDLWYQVTQQLSLTGIALVWKPTYNEYQIPEELYTITSSSALPWPPSPIYPHGSYLIQPYYPYGPFSTVPSYQSAAGARIPAEQIIRIKNHHPVLRYDGYAVLTAMQRQMDVVESIDLARWTTQQKGVDPTLSVEFDPEVYNPDVTDFKRLRVQLEALYAGPQNAGKLMFNPIGSKLSKVSNSPSEMAWQEGWEQLVKFVLAAYGTPSAVTGMADASSYASLYASLRQFHLISLCPLLSKIDTKFTSQLLRPYYGEDLYLQLKARNITDEDMEIKKLSMVLPANVLRRNELRKFLDLAPIKGPEGDEWVGKASIKEEAPAPNPEQAHEVEQMDRPENPQGQGSAPGQRMKAHKIREDKLATLLDDMKHKGLAFPPDDTKKTFSMNGKH